MRHNEVYVPQEYHATDYHATDKERTPWDVCIIKLGQPLEDITDGKEPIKPASTGKCITPSSKESKHCVSHICACGFLGCLC